MSAFNLPFAKGHLFIVATVSCQTGWPYARGTTVVIVAVSENLLFVSKLSWLSGEFVDAAACSNALPKQLEQKTEMKVSFDSLLWNKLHQADISEHLGNV